jgi:general secretion pathway protein H
MVVLGMAIVAVSALYRAPSAGIQLRAAAQLAASRLRDLRATALMSGSERLATIDVNARAIRFSDGRAPLQLARSIDVAVTGAESERRSQGMAGVRFFPNGSSTGATIQLRSQRQAYEVRINWLTGRVSTAPIN